MAQSRIVIFANGHLPNPEAARALLRPDDILLGADGGTRHILDLGLTPALVVGDMDSVEPDTLKRLEKSGVMINRFPRDKNETDLDLALEHARSLNPSAILVVAALGERLDHTIGNLALLASPSLAGLDVRADDGVEEAFFCRDQAEVRGRSGEVVSLIPWHGRVEGVTTRGLKWPLRDETLYPDKTRGISNEMEGQAASVSVRSGVLLVIHRRLTSV
jgi:thiamine pyrophosphokinase